MTQELYFPDPFVEGGWFLFHSTYAPRFPWRTAHLTVKGLDPATLHFTKLKALLYIEKQIQERLNPKKYDAIDISGTYPEDDPTQQTLARLTYDWVPLNAALEAAK